MDVWTWGRVDVWTCGRVDVWTCGRVDGHRAVAEGGGGVHRSRVGLFWREDEGLRRLARTSLASTRSSHTSQTTGDADAWRGVVADR